MYKFSVLKRPGSSASVLFSSNAIKPNYLRTDLSYVPAFNYSISLRQCLRGEKRTDDKACQICAEGTFSLYDYSDQNYEGSVTCDACPEGAYCKG